MSTATHDAGAEGSTAADDATVLTFLDPPPGLGHLDHFALTPLDEFGQLFTLRSVESPDTRLFLLDPEPF